MHKLKFKAKPFLSAKPKAKRVAACKWYLDRLKAEPNFLHRVFFLDCKTLICSPQAAYKHVFNTVQNEFGKRLWLHPGQHDMSTYLAVLEDILFNFITVDSVKKGIDSLPKLRTSTL